jgi:hypothetical protein
LSRLRAAVLWAGNRYFSATTWLLRSKIQFRVEQVLNLFNNCANYKQTGESVLHYRTTTAFLVIERRGVSNLTK